MSHQATEQRILNAVRLVPLRGFHDVTVSQPLTVEALADRLGLGLAQTRSAVSTLWARGVIRATAKGGLVLGRDPQAPCGALVVPGRYCARTYLHEGSCRAK